MKYGEMTYEEIRDAAQQGWLAVVPTGCTEQQGPHLPVDFDTWFAEQVCLSASAKAEKEYGVRSLVLPTMPFGPTTEHKSFGSGYIDIPAELHEALVYSILKSLAEQGFRRIVVWRGCAAHNLRETVERFNRDYRRKSRAYLPGFPYHDIWCRIGDPSNPGGHADAFGTSIALYLRPEAVRRDKIANPHSKEVDWNSASLDFGRYSRTGVIGDPTPASAELGKKLWEAVVDEVAAILCAIAEGKKNPRLDSQDRLHFLWRQS
jgi:creatinine amidohydrolase